MPNDHKATAETAQPETTVRVTKKSVSGDPDIDNSAGVVGAEYDVFYFAPPGSPDNDDPSGRGYYLLDTEHTFGGVHWAYPEHVEIVRTPEQKAARLLPERKALLRGVSGALCGLFDPVEVDQVDRAGKGALIAYGATDEGLRVSFRVRIDQIEEVDY